MTGQPRLIPEREPDDPEGAVLVLHGGASRRPGMMVSPAQLSVLRMIPIASRIAHAGKGKLAVFRVLNSVRGWDSKHTPVDDARWAMAQVRQRYGHALPTCLVGHSLGGRAALLAGSAEEVRSVVALAPWLYSDEGEADLAGRQVLIVHGSADRIAKPANSAAVARRLGQSTQVGYVLINGGKHAMLRHHTEFDGLATDFATATLLGTTHEGPLGRVMQGQRWVTI